MSNDPKYTIAFQGAPGAHSEVACQNVHPYMHTLPCASFDDVFDAVESGQAELGLIPIENSQAGRVAEIHNILPHTNLHIVGEYFHKVHHQLIGIKGAKKDQITSAMSHSMALMQCHDYMRGHKIESVPFTDTAAAVAEVARLQDPAKAAIASELAASIHGLEILDRNIEDDDNNTTVFVTFSREPLEVDPETKDQMLTTVLFTTRNLPAGLYKVLGGFATNGINLVKIESYIPDYGTGTAQFFATFEGHLDQEPVKRALEEIGFFTQNFRILGVYPADPARYGSR